MSSPLTYHQRNSFCPPVLKTASWDIPCHSSAPEWHITGIWTLKTLVTRCPHIPTTFTNNAVNGTIIHPYIVYYAKAATKNNTAIHIKSKQSKIKSYAYAIIVSITKYIFRGYHTAAPSFCNSLPLNVRTDYNSLHGFKNNLKTQLFLQDYI